MITRRDFLKRSALGVAALGAAPAALDGCGHDLGQVRRRPLVVSTWKHGLPANEAAWEILGADGRALDAVEAGVRVTEADPTNLSVGIGGLPDCEGRVTLDACIMDELGNCGSVACLENILHPVSVARLVMEKTPHVMLVGEGARQFALAQGFTEVDLLTPAAEAAWREWLAEDQAQPVPSSLNHDTIGLLAIDRAGNLSGSCTTSGLAFKLPGRVGDSPLIGAGLFVDNEVGAACATGLGEEVIKTVGSFLVVELMRQGKTPAAACREAVRRIVSGRSDLGELQVGYLALNKAGEVGSFSVRSEFEFALHDVAGNSLIEAPSWH